MYKQGISIVKSKDISIYI